MRFDRQTFRLLFLFICMATVSGMIYYWVYKFLVEDRDMGLVDYEDIDELDIDLPVVSICIQDPFLENEIKKLDPDLNKTTYLKHLKGDIYDKRFEEAEYESLTLSLNDYLQKIWISFRNGSSRYFSHSMFSHDITFNGFFDNDLFVKCFAYHIDKKEYPNIEVVSYSYNDKKFRKDVPNLSKKILSTAVTLWVHYPGQILLRMASSYFSMTHFTMFMEINIIDIEFLQSRKKRTRKCEANWQSYDNIVLKNHFAKHGCVAPYHSSYQLGQICKNRTQIKNYFYHFRSAREGYPQQPCTRISELRLSPNYAYVGNWEIGIRYPKLVKTIKQSQEVDFHSLIGNIGGYIGLFLGNISLIIKYIEKIS